MLVTTLRELMQIKFNFQVENHFDFTASCQLIDFICFDWVLNQNCTPQLVDTNRLWRTQITVQMCAHESKFKERKKEDRDTESEIKKKKIKMKMRTLKNIQSGCAPDPSGNRK